MLLRTAKRGQWRPRQFYGINWDSWQAEGLAYWWPLYRRGDYTDVIRREVLTEVINTGSPSTRATEMGTGLYSSNNAMFRASATAPDPQLVPITMACWAMPEAFTDGPVAMSICDDATSDRYFFLRCSSGGVVTAQQRNVAAAEATAGTATTNRWQHLAGRFSTNALRHAALNGVVGASNTTSITAFTTHDRIGLYGLDRLGSPFIRWYGLLADCRIYRTALTDAQLWALYDPQSRWDLYWQPSTRAYLFLAVGATFKAAWARGSNIVIGGVHAP